MAISLVKKMYCKPDFCYFFNVKTIAVTLCVCLQVVNHIISSTFSALLVLSGNCIDHSSQILIEARAAYNILYLHATE